LKEIVLGKRIIVKYYSIVIVGEQEASATGAIADVQVSVSVSVSSVHAGSTQDETFSHAG
jgi:hypothetical protein